MIKSAWALLIFPASIITGPLSGGVLTSLVAVTIMLFCSALVSGSEVAFFSLSQAEMSRMRKKKSYRARAVVRLMQQPKYLLSTILVANNLVNVAIIITSSWVVLQLFDFTQAPLLGFIAEVVAITFLLLLFGEITPKTYATQYNARLAQFMAVPLLVMQKAFYPVSYLLVNSTRFIESRIHQKKHDVTAEELSDAIDLTTLEDASREEKRILKGLVKFGNISAKQIMCNRMEVVAVDTHKSFDELLAVIKENGFSRIPVYKDTFDNVEGILYSKDLLAHTNGDGTVRWQKLVRPPFFVPETKKIGDLLKEFQHKKVHMAIVVDEYGGTSGIVTLEDVLEEIVGDIKDEYDEEEVHYLKTGTNSYIFEARTLLSDVIRIFNLPADYFEDVDGEAESLAGLILELAGSLPERNAEIDYKDFRFVIESVTRKRINKVRVIREMAKPSKSANPDTTDKKRPTS